jgi:hypothetical protein
VAPVAAAARVVPVERLAAAGAGGGSNEHFSFFYTSLDAMRRLSKSQNGFGGDLRFGAQSGLEGADKICQTIASDVGFGNKTWRAFLSVVRGPDGMPVHAIDRIGQGPWYDRRGRVIAMNRAGLLAGNRPGGDAAAVNDLPDETGQGTRRLGDTHDVVTGSNTMGMLRSPVLGNTCQDWTSAMGGRDHRLRPCLARGQRHALDPGSTAAAAAPPGSTWCRTAAATARASGLAAAGAGSTASPCSPELHPGPRSRHESACRCPPA